MNPAGEEKAVAPKIPFRFPKPASRLKDNSGKNAYAEHRQAQRERSDQATSMAVKYPQLKSLKLSLEFKREGMEKTSQMKYSANPEHAKSVLVFACPTAGCVGGDFDLTAKLAEAVAARRTRVTGRIFCLGNNKKEGGKFEPCRSELSYTLTLAYA